MALNKTQYDSIQRKYEETQLRNRHLLLNRREQVYARLPGYRQLEETQAVISVEHARRLIDGDESALTEVRAQLKELSRQKAAMLSKEGFPADYLQPVYDCPDCQDTGYRQGVKCHCFRQQEISLLYDQSGIRELIERENFSTLSYDYYRDEDLALFQEAVNVSRKFIADFGTEYQNLFFYGKAGLGKSFLSGCIARELLNAGCSVIYFSAVALFENYSRYSFDAKSKEALYNFCEDLYNCDLVIIDDLGTEVTNAFTSSQLFGLLNERDLRRRATIISTNLELSELRNVYSDRIFSRVASHYTICKLTGQDIRLQKKI